jgi:hypothetical protein
MATLRHFVGYFAIAASVLPLGCGKSVGLGGTVTPLAHIHVQVTGDLPPEVASDPTHLHVALVWGLQWQPEPFCAFPPPEAADVVAAGCPDNFGFVPNLVGADVMFQPGLPATLELSSLPAADVMVGDLSSRVAYGSIVLYDDVNQNGALDLRTPPRFRRRGQNQPPIAYDGGVAGPRDIVVGASFISMTQPDTRVAFLEGTFNESVAFYPRQNCPDPPKGFSILSAGGFAPADTSALLAGQPLPSGLPFPEETSCATAAIDDPIMIDLSALTVDSGQTVDLGQPVDSGQPVILVPLAQLACGVDPENGSGPHYLQALNSTPDTVKHQCACTSFPHVPGDDAGVPDGKQVVCASTPSEPCRYVVHYTLRGCDNDPSCAFGYWDDRANPPDWWKTLCPTWP